MNAISPFVRWIAIVLLSTYLVACDDGSKAPSPAPTPVALDDTPPAIDSDLAAALTQLEAAKRMTVSHATTCTTQLHTQFTETFLATPSQALLNEQYTALAQCLAQYLPLHFLATGPTADQYTALTQSIYSAPILPGYIDYLLAYPNSGIVNDITVPLSGDTIRQQQGLTDSGEISLGFEVMAFLLAGEQRYNHSLAPRPVSDFSEQHARRRQYASITLSLLVEDLTALGHLLEASKGQLDLSTLTQQEGNAHVHALLTNMIAGLSEDNSETLSVGFWQLLSYTPDTDTDTPTPSLAQYLKWPKAQPDLSREAFSAQLHASLQRLTEETP